MGFFDGLGKKVVDAGQKTKGMSDAVCINYLIMQEENKINNMYYKIGKLYASIHSNDCEEEFLEMINTIAELEQNIWNYRDQIQNIKGVQCCEKCGADIPKGVLFCSSCGTPIPKTEIQVTDDHNKCPNCGNAVEKGVRFCIFCGNPMGQSEGLNTELQGFKISEDEASFEIIEKQCPNCGSKLEDDFIFCDNCGIKL